MLKISSALELLAISKKYFYISTGSIILDKLLEGGIRSSGLTEIHGLSGCGKTQLCLEILFNAILREKDSMAIYVSSKRCIFPQHIRRLIEQHKRRRKTENPMEAHGSKSNPEDLKCDDILRKILYKQVFDYDELVYAVHYVHTLLSENQVLQNKIRLIVIDSFSTHLRDLTPGQKVTCSYELLGVLSKIAMDYNCAVLLTCEMGFRTVSVDKSTNESNLVLAPVLGEPFIHRVNQSIELENIDDVIQIIIMKSLTGKLGRMKIVIDQELGIIDERRKGLKRKSPGLDDNGIVSKIMKRI